MKHRMTVAAAIIAFLFAQGFSSAHSRNIHKKMVRHGKAAKRGVRPPPGFRAYRATMYGNERAPRARRISRRLPASGIAFRSHAHMFAMNGRLNQRYAVWTPGHGVTTAACTDAGADHPDLADGFFHEIYYQMPSRGGERRGRMSADEAGVMTIWMKRLPGHVDSPLWRARHKKGKG